MTAAKWNLRSTLQETPRLNFVIQSALDDAKLLNWNFRLIESDVLVPAILHAIQRKKSLDNLKLKAIASVNCKLS